MLGSRPRRRPQWLSAKVNFFDPARDKDGKILYDVGGFISFYAQTNKLMNHGVKVNTGFYGTGSIYGNSVFHAWYNTRKNVEQEAFINSQLIDWFDISLEELKIQQELLLQNEDLYFLGLAQDHFINIAPGRWKSPFAI